MSFENNNPENRNNFPTNRINSLRQIARNRCCSFCRSPDHIISLCNDERLQNFENLCTEQKATFEHVDNFKQWLMGYFLENSVLVKSFAVRKCGSTTRTNIQQTIENILKYFYGENWDLPALIEDNDYIPINSSQEINNFEIENLSISLLPYVLVSRFSRQVEWTEATRGRFLNEMFNYIYLGETNLENEDDRKFNINSEVIIREKQCNCEGDCICVCDCNICYESLNISKFVKLNCNHQFCSECTQKSLKSCRPFQEPVCAMCRSKITLLTYSNEEVKAEFDNLIN
jgi:REP element-mobilizing transposase RayT